MVANSSIDWEAPSPLYSELHRTYAFDYDPCSSVENAKTSFFSTLDGTFAWDDTDPEVGGKLRQLSAEHGLEHSWSRRRVFMKPPYARGEIDKWVKKAYDERLSADLIVGLLPAATDTRWFQQYVLPVADVTYLPKRVRFIHPKEPCVSFDYELDGRFYLVDPAGEIGPDYDPEVTCGHALGKPGGNPPTGHIVVVWRADERLAAVL